MSAEIDKLIAENEEQRREILRLTDEIKDVGYIEGMIHIAKRVLSEKKGDR